MHWLFCFATKAQFAPSKCQCSLHQPYSLTASWPYELFLLEVEEEFRNQSSLDHKLLCTIWISEMSQQRNRSGGQNPRQGGNRDNRQSYHQRPGGQQQRAPPGGSGETTQFHGESYHGQELKIPDTVQVKAIKLFNSVSCFHFRQTMFSGAS